MTGPRDEAVVLQATSWLLTYPDRSLTARLPLLADAVMALRPSTARARLLRLIEHLESTPEGDLARHYVEVFDRQRKCCMYLTWWTDGETRRRGMSLARLKGMYREHGMVLEHGELPDFLPVVCEFAATASLERGMEILQEYRAGLELLRLALVELDSPYRWPLEAVCSLLPGPSPQDEAAARALASAGPPTETVGLDTFGAELTGGLISGGRR